MDEVALTSTKHPLWRTRTNPFPCDLDSDDDDFSMSDQMAANSLQFVSQNGPSIQKKDMQKAA